VVSHGLPAMKGFDNLSAFKATSLFFVDDFISLCSYKLFHTIGREGRNEIKKKMRFNGSPRMCDYRAIRKSQMLKKLRSTKYAQIRN
jgi:hypothetical protein